MKIKKGEIVKIVHCRKGTFTGKAQRDFDTEKEEFYPITVVNKTVVGANRHWTEGEYIPCKSSLCSITKEVK